MSMANLYLRALSSPGQDQPKLSTVITDWDLEGVLTAEFSKAHMGGQPRGLHTQDKVAGAWRGQLDNFRAII